MVFPLNPINKVFRKVFQTKVIELIELHILYCTTFYLRELFEALIINRDKRKNHDFMGFL